MATSGKPNKNGKKTTARKSQPSDKTVVPSTKVDAGEATVSRIPPSQPIESGLVGGAEGTTPASRKASATKSGGSALPNTQGRTETAAEAKQSDLPKGDVPAAAVGGGSASRKKSSAGGSGFWPTALGGVVAAGLGAAAAIIAMPYLDGTGDEAAVEQIDPDAVTSDAVAAATEAARAEVAGLRDEAVAAAEEAGAQAAQEIIAEMPEGVDTTAEVQAALQAQAEQIAALEEALAQQEQSAAAPASGSGSDVPSQQGTASDEPTESASAGPDMAAQLEELRQQLSAQQETIAELSNRPQVDPEALERVETLAQNAEQVKSEIESAAAEARDSLSSVQSEAEAATQRAQAVASVAALGAALERGGSPTEAVEQLENSGVEVPEPLAQEDLPTLDQVQIGFDAASRAALRASLQAGDGNGGAMGAVGNFLRMQTGARSVEPREGNSADAILSRAGALVEQGDLSTALEELQALPDAGQEAMADWRAQAEAYLAAEAALNDVANTLN
ncbi:COG4223 family protein [Paracoccus sediminicola]|uniref:COG4223 family protein n=1 Tax=Paracoccus sediminicola TaxID=3017783 RepID=UPI0022F0A785|nr:hypothetical protein [Paracoccus sediminicola]WBU57213.1 hypothetical protein PAF18_01830 [Paracoccus sediminicola]